MALRRENKMKLNKLTKDKRFRYGSVSVVFTAVLVALIIVVNAVFSLIANNFHLYVDMTSVQLYSLSDSFRYDEHAVHLLQKQNQNGCI